MRDAIPNLDEQFEQGEFGPLREWLRDNLHRYGRKFTPQETCSEWPVPRLDAGPYLGYLRDKVGELTGAAAESSRNPEREVSARFSRRICPNLLLTERSI